MASNHSGANDILHVGSELRSSRPMHSADISYLWRLSDMRDMPLRVFMEVSNIAIDDRIPPKGLKE